MLILDGTTAFISLNYLLEEEYNLSDMNIYVDNYIFYQKDNLAPLQIDSSKEHYANLELSSYASQLDEDPIKFIQRYRFVERIFKKLNEPDKK